MTQWGIDTLFNPGKRHMDEEKRRLQSTREEVGDSSGGRRIDLDGGKVRLTGRPGKDSEDGTTDDSAAEGSDVDDSAVEGSDVEDSDVQPPQAEADQDDTPAGRARRRRRAAG